MIDIPFRSHLDSEIKANSDIAYVYIFSAISVFILLIACVNFMNLSTTRSSIRTQEVGLRVVSEQLGHTRLCNPVDALRFE